MAGDVAISRRPTVAVTNLAPPAFDGNCTFQVSWDVPSIATDSQRDDRFEGINVQFVWSASGEGSNTVTGKNQNPNVNAVLSAGNLHPRDHDYDGSALDQNPLNRVVNCGASDTSVIYRFDKNVFFPVYTGYDNGKNLATLKANMLTVRVWGWNAYGHGPASEVSYSFDYPKAVTEYYTDEKSFSEVSINGNVVSRSVEMYPGGTYQHRADARLRIFRGVGTNAAPKPNTVVYNSGWLSRLRNQQSDLDSIPSSYTDNEMAGLTENQILQYQWVLEQRGYHGEQTSTSNFFVRYPPVPTIGDIRLSDPNYTSSTTGTIHIPFTSKYKLNVLSESQFQYSKNRLEPGLVFQLQIAKGATLPAENSGSWNDVSEAQSTILSSAFTDTYDNARPPRGQHVWYRIKANRAGFSGYTVYSKPKEVDKLYRKAISPTDDHLVISSATPDDDGCGISLLLGWTPQDANATESGVEISWSDYINAWESNESPTTLDVTWTDASPAVPNYTKSAHVSIRGLEEGTPYYIRARRYADYGNGKEYGEYVYVSDGTGSNMVERTVVPVSVVQNLRLICNKYKKVGESLYLSWGYDSGSTQKNWIIEYEKDSEWIACAKGENDPKSYTTLRYDSVIKEIFENITGSTITFRVTMSVGGGDFTSNSCEVHYKDEPNVTVSIVNPESTTPAGSTGPAIYVLDEQPVKFTISTQTPQAKCVASVRSLGNSITGPSGPEPQPEGLILWANSYVADDSGNVSGDSVYIPVIEMLKGCSYMLDVSVEDPDLASNTASAECQLEPDWDMDCVPPSYSSTVVANPETKSVTITPIAGSGGNQSDSAEIYRVTPDGAELVLQNAMFGISYTDLYAPYSSTAELRYRIASRTVWRQVEWIDVVYTMQPSIAMSRERPFYSMRFDWGNGRSLEVPYNLQFQDSYSKDFEAKTNLDGTITGWWNSAVKKEKSLKTVALKFSDPETIETIRELAQYTGPVFVRTPDGDAFEADVQVNSLDNTYDGMTITVSFKATALTLTDAFKMSK